MNMIIHLATDNILKKLVMIGSLKIISGCKRNIDNDDAKKGAPDDLRVLTIRLTLDRLIARHTRYGKKIHSALSILLASTVEERADFFR